jgi:hypothetical protein
VSGTFLVQPAAPRRRSRLLRHHSDALIGFRRRSSSTRAGRFVRHSGCRKHRRPLPGRCASSPRRFDTRLVVVLRLTVRASGTIKSSVAHARAFSSSQAIIVEPRVDRAQPRWTAKTRSATQFKAVVQIRAQRIPDTARVK